VLDNRAVLQTIAVMLLLAAGMAGCTLGTTSGSNATPGARPSPSPSGPDITTLARACGAIPGGHVAPYVQPASLVHGTEQDPRTQANLPVIRMLMDAEVPVARPPFSVTGAVQASGKPAGDGPAPIDRLGSTQLWLHWDGASLHKGVRRWSGTAWVMAVDDDASTLTIELRSHSAAFHSADITPGATFAFVTADTGGCAALGLNAEGRPAIAF
jgi:hypothetical protein